MRCSSGFLRAVYKQIFFYEMAAPKTPGSSAGEAKNVSPFSQGTIEYTNVPWENVSAFAETINPEVIQYHPSFSDGEDKKKWVEAANFFRIECKNNRIPLIRCIYVPDAVPDVSKVKKECRFTIKFKFDPTNINVEIPKKPDEDGDWYNYKAWAIRVKYIYRKFYLEMCKKDQLKDQLMELLALFAAMMYKFKRMRNPKTVSAQSPAGAQSPGGLPSPDASHEDFAEFMRRRLIMEAIGEFANKMDITDAELIHYLGTKSAPSDEAKVLADEMVKLTVGDSGDGGGGGGGGNLHMYLKQLRF